MLLGIVALALLATNADKGPATLDDLKSAYQSLKTADDQKDSVTVERWAVETLRLGKALTETKKTAGEEDLSAEDRKSLLEFVNSTATFAEYTLSAAALRERSPQKLMDLVDTLQAHAPDSKYLPPLFSPYVSALEQTGKPDKAYQFAERSIARAPSNEDLLLILANGALTRKQWDRAATFGTRLASTMTTHARPEGISAADWERKKSLLLGRGYYIAGMGYANSRKDMLTDKNLRAALPYIKGEPTLAGASLFYLSLADYNIARTTFDQALMKDALNFSQQAAAIPGAFQQQARQNVAAMTAELERIKHSGVRQR